MYINVVTDYYCVNCWIYSKLIRQLLNGKYLVIYNGWSLSGHDHISDTYSNHKQPRLSYKKHKTTQDNEILID